MRTRVLSALSLAALVASACTQEPAAIVLENAPATIETMDAIALPKAVVKDEDGQPLDPQPELDVTASPEKILQLTGTMLTPIKSGKAKLVYKLKEGELQKEHPITVQLVDLIKLNCEPEECKFAPGTTFRVRAAAMSGGGEVKGAEFLWSSSDESVVKVKGNGEFEAVKPGTAKIEAQTRGIAAAETVVVSSPVEQLVVVCPSPPFSVLAPSSGSDDRRCVVGAGEAITLSAEVRGGGKVMERRVAWKSTDSRYVMVSAGVVQGAQEGAAIVEASVENVRLQLPVEVRRGATAKCEGPIATRYELPDADPARTFLCGGDEAVRCMTKAANGKRKLSEVALSAAGRKCCCTEVPALPGAKQPPPEEKKEGAEGDDAKKAEGDDAKAEGDDAKAEGDDAKAEGDDVKKAEGDKEG